MVRSRTACVQVQRWRVGGGAGREVPAIDERFRGTVGASDECRMHHPSPLPTRAIAPAAILVVDDERGSRAGLELLLRGSGYRVASAASADAALRHARQHWLDLVITDVNLPKTDGYRLTELLRSEARNRDVPIVLVSGEATSQRRVTGLDRGADDFLEKPLDADELLARVRMHLRHGERQADLLRRSEHDALTGLLNRGAIEEELAREMKRSYRTKLPVSVVMVDVDDFKAVNDRFGHTAGDEALREVGAALAHLLRSTDRVGRFGGDEFLAVLPDTDWAALETLVHRLRSDWQRYPPTPRGVPVPVMVSLGAATAERGESIEALIRRADIAMYADKRGCDRALA